MAMPAWLYESGPNGLWIFLLLTVAFGGGAAFASGKAIAETWRPAWHILIYAILIGGGVRFLHFALFQERMISLQNFVVDLGVLLPAGLLGATLARRRQMRLQYGWNNSPAEQPPGQ